jgi:hypothetical protein
MCVPATQWRSEFRPRARLALPKRARGALAAALLVSTIGACVRAPALVLAARSTLGSGDRRPLRVVVSCGLDWSKPLHSVSRNASAAANGGEAELEIDSPAAESECVVAALCDWEARARQAALSRMLADLAEAAP